MELNFSGSIRALTRHAPTLRQVVAPLVRPAMTTVPFTTR